MFCRCPSAAFRRVVAPFDFPALHAGTGFYTVPSASNATARIATFSIVASCTGNVGCPLTSFGVAPSITVISPTLTRAVPTGLATRANVSTVARTVRTCISALGYRCASPLTLRTVRVVRSGLGGSCRNSVTYHSGVRSTRYLTNVTFSGTLLNVIRSVTRGANTTFANNRVVRNYTGTVCLPGIVGCGSGSPITTRHCTGVTGFVGLGNRAARRLISTLVTRLHSVGSRLGVPRNVGGCNPNNIGTSRDVVSRGRFLRGLPRITGGTVTSTYANSGPHRPGRGRVRGLLGTYCCSARVSF